MKLSLKWISYYIAAWFPKVSLVFWSSYTVILFLCEIFCKITSQLWKNILWSKIIFSFSCCSLELRMCVSVCASHCTYCTICLHYIRHPVISWKPEKLVGCLCNLTDSCTFVLCEYDNGNLEETKLCAMYDKWFVFILSRKTTEYSYV